MKKLMLTLMAVLMTAPLFAGKVVTVRGKADMLRNGKWTAIKKGMVIKNNTRIMTGMRGYVRVKERFGTFSVRELSMLTYHEKSGKKSNFQKVNLKIGHVRVSFKRIKGIKAGFKVRTPQGTASVRGTEQLVSFVPGQGMNVQVIHGIVQVLNNQGSGIPTSLGQNLGIDPQGNLHDQWDNVKNFFQAYYPDVADWNDLNPDQINQILNDVFNLPQIINILNGLGEPERL